MTPTFPVNRRLVAGDWHAVNVAAMRSSAASSLIACDFQSLQTETSTRAPVVFPGWVPPKPIEGEQYPFLIVRPVSGADSEQSAEENATANFQIIVGTFSDTDDGWIDVMLLIDAVRNSFGSEPAIKGTSFEQTGPMTWNIPQEQPRPQWIGIVNTIWTIPRPRRVEARNPEDRYHGHHD